MKRNRQKTSVAESSSGDHSPETIPPSDPRGQAVITPPTDPGDTLDDQYEEERFPKTPIPDNYYDLNFDSILAPPTEPGDLIYDEAPATEPKVHLAQIQDDSWLTSQSATEGSLLKTLLLDCLVLVWGKWGSVILISVLLFSYQGTVGTLNGPVKLSTAIEWGANFAPKTNGPLQEWWRLLTAPFLHWDFQHLFFNLFVLSFLSIHIEGLLGMVGLWSVFLSTAILAGTSTLAFYPSQVSMGASGGIYGLFGALLTLLIVTRGRRVYQARFTSIVMILWLLYVLVTNLSSPWVDNASHLGGMCAGLIVGVFSAPLYRHSSLTLGRRLRSVTFPLIFALGTITLFWSFLPPPHPVFSLLAKYGKELDRFEENAHLFDSLEPLEQRVLWENEIKPSLLVLDNELQKSLQGEPPLDRSELKTTTEATQWVLKRLIQGWWTRFGTAFEQAPSHLSLRQDQSLPFEVARSLYESLFAQNAIIDLTEASWDERVAAIRIYKHWRNQDQARHQLSVISAALIEEASSPSVRLQGSLWGRVEIREERFAEVERALLGLSDLSVQDYVTLNKLNWLRGESDSVIESCREVLRAILDKSLTATELDRQKLAHLLYRALLSSPYSHLERLPQLDFDGQHLNLGTENLSLLGRLYITVERCHSTDSAETGKRPLQSSSKQEDDLDRLLIEASIPDLSSPYPAKLKLDLSNILELKDRSCLKSFKPIAWVSDETIKGNQLRIVVYD